MKSKSTARDVVNVVNLPAASSTLESGKTLAGTVDLVYASRSNGQLATTASLDALVERASAANAAHRISGILVSLNGNYLQWLQGPSDKVKTLTANIERDSRHTDFEILLHRPAQHRLIQPWGGYTVERREAIASARERVLNFSRSARSGTTFAPEDFMRALCWPSVVPHVSETTRPVRVVLFGATLMWTSAIITSASLKHGVATGRTRFSDVASQSRSETLVEYVDYSLAQAAPVRLMACEISSVHNNLAVSIFAEADTLVFMIGSLNNEYLRDLVVSAAALCKQRAIPPRIVFLLARRASIAENALCELARESGFAPEVILVSTLADSREALAVIEASLHFEIELRDKREQARRSEALAQNKARSHAACSSAAFESELPASGTNAPALNRSPDLPTPAETAPPADTPLPSINAGHLKIVPQNTRALPLPGKKIPSPSPLKAALTLSQPLLTESTPMANVTETLNQILTIDGAMACALVDYTSGMTLGTAGSGINLDVAAAGNTEVLRSKMKVASALGLTGAIEDILITLTSQYHILRPMASQQGLFLYVVIDRAKGNLAMARFKIGEVEKALKV